MAFRLTPVLVLVCVSLAMPAVAQPVSGPASPQATVVPVRLPHPEYPFVAMAVLAQGEVEVAVSVSPDGRVASPVVRRSIPVLDQAAIDAASKAQFECRGCVDGSTPYSIVYKFELATGEGNRPGVSPWPGQQPEPVQIASGGSRVTTLAEIGPPLCILRTPIGVPARSAKCIWLWKCGFDAQ